MTTGIGDMAVYVPPLRMALDRLQARYREADADVADRFDRAMLKTGQRAIRFPANWEDAATMAGQAALNLLTRFGGKDLSRLRYLIVGTETAVDFAKPIAAYVVGMLRRAGVPIPASLSAFQTTHACASGTVALLGVSAMLAVAAQPADCGLVICTDVARYEAGSTAEITQGAGAVAMLAEPNPGLVEFDIASPGYATDDVDDFFRPVGASTPQVKGRYSIECYKRSLGEALDDYCTRSGQTAGAALSGADIIAMHAPYHDLPGEAMRELLSLQLGLDEAGATAFLQERSFSASVMPSRTVGNLYSGSVFLGLASALQARYQEVGERIVGKRVLLFSYGSGSTAVILAGRVAPGAPATLAKWDLEQQLNHAKDASWAEYDRWMMNGHGPAGAAEEPAVPPRRFYLDHVREDGYRVYDVTSA
jgi:hydroxymethylglutaryl-CoA synthase